MDQVAQHPMRRWRKANNRTLTVMAEAVGVKPSHLSQIECGHKHPSINLASRLVRASEELAQPGQDGIKLDDFVGSP